MAHHQFPNECGDPHRPHSSEDSSNGQSEATGGPPAPANPNPPTVPLDDWAPGGSAMMTRHASSPGGHSSPVMRYPAVSRSIPIAIRRTAATPASEPGDTTTSDEDDIDDLLDGHGGQSAKDGLLRAPFLGSLPSSRNAEELMSHNDILLPAASLAQEEPNVHPTRGVAASYSGGMGVGGAVGRAGYGSLRESNMMGRFLDGPASYRERGTGGIVQLRNRVRFDAAASLSNASHNSSSSTQPISIGDQLMMHARRRQDDAGAVSSSDEPQQPPPPSSSLAAMLESSSLEHASQPKSQGESNTASVQSEYDAPGSSMFDDYDAADPAVLSMSLTGLEVLHSLRHLRGASSRNGFRNGGGNSLLHPDPDVLPRDASGQNALLSRSFSDPTPRFRRLDLRQAGEPRTLPSPGPFPIGHVPTSAPTHSETPFDFHGERRPPAAYVASPISVQTDAFPTQAIYEGSGAQVSNDAARAIHPLWEEGTAPPTSHDNPDTEGAFEMDLE